MMNQNHKKTKNTFHAYAAWDFDKEAEELNKMSEKGWQLVVGNCFHQKYEFDDSVIYRYQIDFNNKIPDMARYDETFLDAGWERVSSTSNDWHIFRKVYDPALPAEEYEIYTDEQSRIEMLKRWRRIAVISAGACALTAVSPVENAFGGNYNTAASIALIAMYLLIAFTEVIAFVSINRLINGKENKHRFPFSLLFVLIILLMMTFLLSSLTGTGNRWFAVGILVGVVLGLILIIIAGRKTDKTNKSV